MTFKSVLLGAVSVVLLSLPSSAVEGLRPVAARAGTCYAECMFDTLAVAQQLAAGGVDRDEAEVIAGAIRQGVEQGSHVTSDQFKAGLAELRTEIANLETRLIRWMVGTVIATATVTVGVLRLVG